MKKVCMAFAAAAMMAAVCACGNSNSGKKAAEETMSCCEGTEETMDCCGGSEGNCCDTTVVEDAVILEDIVTE